MGLDGRYIRGRQGEPGAGLDLDYITGKPISNITGKPISKISNITGKPISKKGYSWCLNVVNCKDMLF